MKTVKDIFYFVEDVMTITGLSRSKSYKIIADLNRELSDRGYLEAARVLREASDAPAADVAEVEHGKPITKIRTVMLTGYHEEIGVFAADGSNLYRKKMAQADIPYDHCPVYRAA